MNLQTFRVFTRLIFLILIIKCCYCDDDEVCEMKPLGSQTAPLPPDDRFTIDIERIGIENLYIPKAQYDIRLYSKNSVSTFIAFTIFARGDTVPDTKNPLKVIRLDPGRIIPASDEVKSCGNASVIQSDITPKKSVKAIWLAPAKEMKCVTIGAVVAISKDVWYSYEGPLSKRVCEDHRKEDDIQPTQNANCQVCEDARYMLVFEGMWSYNTHPLMFPQTRELARFSDVVGASHGNNFNLYKYNAVASDGLRMLALQGNTTKLEMEIQKKLGNEVRSIIKATGALKPNMSTSTTFRAGPQHHYVSLLIAILPSPDWFLGVANLELCDSQTNNWSKNIRLNLYPLDAGVDSGLTFESPNEETSPPRAISSASIAKDVSNEQKKPFAKLHFQLIRTYKTINCENVQPMTTLIENIDNYIDVQETSVTPPPVLDPASPSDCPMSEWEDWMECEGECGTDKIKRGYHTRLRYHIVDGVIVGKYDKASQNSADTPEIPRDCLDLDLTDTAPCEVSCEEEEDASEEK